MRNFRVYYKIHGQQFQTDFSMDGEINNYKKNISAWHQIKKSHPDVRREDVSIITIEELEVW